MKLSPNARLLMVYIIREATREYPKRGAELSMSLPVRVTSKTCSLGVSARVFRRARRELYQKDFLDEYEDERTGSKRRDWFVLRARYKGQSTPVVDEVLEVANG